MVMNRMVLGLEIVECISVQYFMYCLDYLMKLGVFFPYPHKNRFGVYIGIVIGEFLIHRA